ncbi:HTH-type transcriptional regulatory protein GabR [Paenibacillus plantiphilus]|uniref:HTH-type transcriptional regulatory protein GabR n=1 Tax=Paenibacillus plantiphilus TaxID=2905650 RepID=A0ABM9BZ10_9BACL|nr:PLP-dependent aminotransferase family protein [Paenibacillus plantiphilus]CAH1198983.1 HTH-type transcriptional regulatory protein GabR [Paenibacillus plantiphilus]
MIDIMLPDKNEGPLYLALYKRLRELILSGLIKDGKKLPSIRSLREQAGLSKTTIETAYQMLLEEGYVYSKPRSGLFVVNPERLASSLVKPYNNAADIIQRDRPHRHLPISQDGNGQQPIDFNLLAIDRASFPVRAWKSVLNEALSQHFDAVHQYGDPKGEYSLCVSICEYLKHSRGVNCSPEQIIVGSGISYSIHVLSKLLADVDTIAVEEAGFAGIRDIFHGYGFKVAPVPLQAIHANAPDKGNKNAIYVTPSHRPTGSPLPYSLRQQLLDWADHNDAYIIEDDYDGEFRYRGKTIPSLQGLDQQGVVIYMGTFSKALTPALRMNYMVLPRKLLEQLPAIEHTLSSPSRIDQWAMQLFIERGHWYRHIRRMRMLYRKKHAKLLQAIAAHLAGTAEVSGEGAGLYVELTVNAACSVDELIKLAAAAGVRVYGSQLLEAGQDNGSDSRNDSETEEEISSGSGSERCSESSGNGSGNPRLYLGFGGINDRDMEQGIQLLARAWSSIAIHSPVTRN